MDDLDLGLISISAPDKDNKIKIEVIQGDPFRDENDFILVNFDKLHEWVADCGRNLDVSRS